ncbi:MAG TPA: hypothetical protein VD866_07830 [Urbifossiella sp.]|nr:hypothetical protein [Urbifossiella sp.]
MTAAAMTAGMFPMALGLGEGGDQTAPLGRAVIGGLVAGTLRTEIDLPNPDGKVRPGMYVVARLTAELPADWAVPAAAVGKVGDESVMYLVEGGKAVRVAVQLHRGDAQYTQVRRYRRPGAADWTDVTGAESVATPAAALADGQPVP